MTAWNFAQLAQKHYFDRSSFMRVVPNFVIQGGDPRNDMEGGPGYAIRDEINLQKYTRGAVGMALSGPDTGGSQFFITHSAQPHLDGGYTIFGRISGGMAAVVDQTERGDQVETILIDQPVTKSSRLERSGGGASRVAQHSPTVILSREDGEGSQDTKNRVWILPTSAHFEILRFPPIAHAASKKPSKAMLLHRERLPFLTINRCASRSALAHDDGWFHLAHDELSESRR